MGEILNTLKYLCAFFDLDDSSYWQTKGEQPKRTATSSNRTFSLFHGSFIESDSPSHLGQDCIHVWVVSTLLRVSTASTILQDWFPRYAWKSWSGNHLCYACAEHSILGEFIWKLKWTCWHSKQLYRDSQEPCRKEGLGRANWTFHFTIPLHPESRRFHK